MKKNLYLLLAAHETVVNRLVDTGQYDLVSKETRFAMVSNLMEGRCVVILRCPCGGCEPNVYAIDNTPPPNGS